MFVLPPNTILFICVAIIACILGFIVYGLIVGFENTFKDSESKQSDH
jgi:hypothetical protein